MRRVPHPFPGPYGFSGPARLLPGPYRLLPDHHGLAVRYGLARRTPGALSTPESGFPTSRRPRFKTPGLPRDPDPKLPGPLRVPESGSLRACRPPNSRLRGPRASPNPGSGLLRVQISGSPRAQRLPNPGSQAPCAPRFRPPRACRPPIRGFSGAAGPDFQPSEGPGGPGSFALDVTIAKSVPSNSCDLRHITIVTERIGALTPHRSHSQQDHVYLRKRSTLPSVATTALQPFKHHRMISARRMGFLPLKAASDPQDQPCMFWLSLY